MVPSHQLACRHQSSLIRSGAETAREIALAPLPGGQDPPPPQEVTRTSHQYCVNGHGFACATSHHLYLLKIQRMRGMFLSGSQFPNKDGAHSCCFPNLNLMFIYVIVVIFHLLKIDNGFCERTVGRRILEDVSF